MNAQIKADARFAMIPEWLLDLEDISATAIRLYCVLDRYADAQGHAFPSRRALAERLGVKSPDTVDRALKELVAAHAVTVTRRYDDAGDPTSNLYIVHKYPPEGVAARMRPPSPSGAATGPQGSGDGSRTDAALNENHLNQNPLTPASGGPTPQTTCSRHPAGDGLNCRACGTTSRQRLERAARDAAARKRAADAQELADARAAKQQAAQLNDETRAKIAAAKATAAAARRRPA